MFIEILMFIILNMLLFNMLLFIKIYIKIYLTIFNRIIKVVEILSNEETGLFNGGLFGI